jgi:hypothetical protein
LVVIKFIIIVTSVLLVTHMDLPSLEITVVLDGNVIHLVILVLVFFVNLWNIYGLPEDKCWDNGLSEHY